jgi:hypothetical protein
MYKEFSLSDDPRAGLQCRIDGADSTLNKAIRRCCKTGVILMHFSRLHIRLQPPLVLFSPQRDPRVTVQGDKFLMQEWVSPGENLRTIVQTIHLPQWDASQPGALQSENFCGSLGSFLLIQVPWDAVDVWTLQQGYWLMKTRPAT